MNTNPDNQNLLLWLEDELAREEQVRIDAWAVDQPEWLAKRESARQWRAQLSRVIPASEPLPYGDFFQSQLFRAIESSKQVASAPAPVTSVPFWRKWAMPLSVAAAMVLGFFGGTQWRAKPDRATTLVTYTPAEGVKAEFFETSPAEGTVIVLSGITALPDAFVNTETAASGPHGLQHSNQKTEEAKTREAATLVAP